MTRIILFVILSTATYCGEYILHWTPTCYHYDHGGYNENNQMVGLEYKKDEFGIMLATMKNSFYRRSNMTMITYKKSWFISGLGYATGYKKVDYLPKNDFQMYRVKSKYAGLIGYVGLKHKNISFIANPVFVAISFNIKVGEIKW